MIIYKCIASTSVNSDKVCLGTAEGEFKKWYHNDHKSFRHRIYASETTLSKYVWEIKDKYNEMPSLKSSVWSLFHDTRMFRRGVYCVSMKSLRFLITLTRRNYWRNDPNQSQSAAMIISICLPIIKLAIHIPIVQ